MIEDIWGNLKLKNNNTISILPKVISSYIDKNGWNTRTQKYLANAQMDALKKSCLITPNDYNRIKTKLSEGSINNRKKEIRIKNQPY